MAHMIQNNMIAWKGQKPWHGLGFEVADNATGADMLKVAGLDWKVQTRALAMRNNVGEGLLTEPLTGFKAIVRSDNDQVFAIPTKRYQIVQNAQIVELFREYCEAGHAKMETVGGLRNGAVVWALAKLNGGSTATLAGGDELNGYILFSTSHDGSLATVGKATQIRVVCHNTLTAALHGGSDFKVKHTAKWTPERAAEAKKALRMALAQVQEMNHVAEQLSHVNIDRKGQIEFISRLAGGKCLLDQVIEDTTIQVGAGSLIDRAIASTHVTTSDDSDVLNRVGKAILDAILDSPGSDLASAKGTLWGAVNGVSYYTDHVAGRTQDTRLNNAWFGANNDLKRDAVNVAMEIAGLRK